MGSWGYDRRTLTKRDDLPSRVDKLREINAVQQDNGNWNFDPYMHGMANGLELATAIIEDREPNYKDAPDRWLADSRVMPKGD